MKKVLVCLFAAMLLLATVGMASAVVLDFEDLLEYGSMPNPYHGIIDWENGVWNHYEGEQYPYTPSSGTERLYADMSDYTPSWSFLTDVVYNGSVFSGGYNSTVQMDLYYNGSLVHSTGVFAPSEVPTFLATGYSGAIDAVTINSPGSNYWVMDDLNYTPVPEPGTLLLVASGLVGLAGFKKKKD